MDSLSNNNSNTTSGAPQTLYYTKQFVDYLFDLQESSTGNVLGLEQISQVLENRLKQFSDTNKEQNNNNNNSNITSNVAKEGEKVATETPTSPRETRQSQRNEQQPQGIIGPARLVLPNKKSSFGQFLWSEDELEVEGLSNFSSMRANVCVHKGKWMYEATLGTAGVQQIGWATLDTVFTLEAGVGDSPDSYAYDGKRIKKWNVQPTKYGQAWAPGDVIGCCIDLDNGQVSFYCNGAPLGVAFSHIRFNENSVSTAYFPAASLSYTERCRFNFGGTPFVFPVEGFSPLQAPPPAERLAKAEYLLRCYRRLLLPTDIPKEDLVILAAQILPSLAELLQDQYIVASTLYPFLENLLGEDGGDQLVSSAIQYALLSFEPEELNVILKNLFFWLSYKSQIASTLDMVKSKLQFPALHLMSKFLAFPQIVEAFMTTSSFSWIMEGLLTTKILNAGDLAKIIPVVWWPNTEEEVCSKEKMEESMSALKQAVTKQEDFIFDICMSFLKNSNEIVSPTATAHRSIRNLFRDWVRKTLEKNKGSNRNVLPPGLSNPTVLYNLYWVLLRTLQPQFDPSIEITSFPKAMFYSKLDYFDFTRVGGALSHLQKNLPIPAEEAEKDNQEELLLEAELADDLVLLYHLGMAASFKQAILFSQNQTQSIAQLDDTNKRIKRAREQNHQQGVEHLILAKKVFLEDAIENVRQFNYAKASLYAPAKQEMMFNFIRHLVKLLEFLSQFNPLFSYVPESYIETVVDSFHSLRRGDPAFVFIDTNSNNADSRGSHFAGLVEVINFLISHFHDKRVVNPDTRDLLLQSLSVLLQYREYVSVFETAKIDRHYMMKELITAFDSRFWMTILNILLRFWRGSGFGQSSKKKSESSSSILQAVFREVCTNNPELLNEFINKIFNNLNWAFTEFGVGSKELQGAISRHFGAELQQYQRKCIVMFELSVSLTRMVEFICREVPRAFLDQEINITRLGELVLFVLNRTTVGPDAKMFDQLLKLSMQGLDKITRVGVLAPLVGIILNLVTYKESTSFSLAKVLASTGGYKSDVFQALYSFEWNKAAPDEAELDDKLAILRKFIDDMEQEFSRLKQEEENQSLSHSQSADFCAICCASVIDTRFEPCKHRSCNRCIKRHLLNSNKCFFCNAEIQSTVLETDMDTTNA